MASLICRVQSFSWCQLQRHRGDVSLSSACTSASEDKTHCLRMSVSFLLHATSQSINRFFVCSLSYSMSLHRDISVGTIHHNCFLLFEIWGVFLPNIRSGLHKIHNQFFLSSYEKKKKKPIHVRDHISLQSASERKPGILSISCLSGIIFRSTQSSSQQSQIISVLLSVSSFTTLVTQPRTSQINFWGSADFVWINQTSIKAHQVTVITFGSGPLVHRLSPLDSGIQYPPIKPVARRKPSSIDRKKE